MRRCNDPLMVAVGRLGQFCDGKHHGQKGFAALSAPLKRIWQKSERNRHIYRRKSLKTAARCPTFSSEIPGILRGSQFLCDKGVIPCKNM